MPMRICSRCLRFTDGAPQHPECQPPSPYRQAVHLRVGKWYRDNNVPCTECGTHGTLKNPIEAHHNGTPVAEGGTNSIEDYQPLCRSCNAARGRRTGTQ